MGLEDVRGVGWARINRKVSKPVQSPYPPDEPGESADELDDLVDAVATGRDWANVQALRLTTCRAELERVRLTGAELAEASLTDTKFQDCRLDLAGLRHAKLQRVVFRDCRMEECDFYGASMKDVLFERCELREATFSAAMLERVELRDCDLTGLNGPEALRGARMPLNDVLANALMFAAVVGIEIAE